ncbi:MAG: hypothetical protein KC561_18680, partial [Myxococcales bacterium]|nr:hypothetical protein [Myxococcales bacterium]
MSRIPMVTSRRLPFLAFLPLAALVLGCGGEEPGPPAPANDAQSDSISDASSDDLVDASRGTVIGPDGGVVESEDGRFSLTIPEGALAEATAIEIAAVSDVATLVGAEQRMYFSPAYRMTPEDLQLSTPAEFRLTMTRQEASDGGRLAVEVSVPAYLVSGNQAEVINNSSTVWPSARADADDVVISGSISDFGVVGFAKGSAGTTLEMLENPLAEHFG